jgi:hypothetical protein
VEARLMLRLSIVRVVVDGHVVEPGIARIHGFWVWQVHAKRELLVDVVASRPATLYGRLRDDTGAVRAAITGPADLTANIEIRFDTPFSGQVWLGANPKPAEEGT